MVFSWNAWPGATYPSGQTTFTSPPRSARSVALTISPERITPETSTPPCARKSRNETSVHSSGTAGKIRSRPPQLWSSIAFTAAVNEMLLQSWGGRLRIFPAVPEEWTDVSFRDLRAQGGVLVSGVMRSGEIVSATLRAERGGEVKVVWPLGYVAPGQAFQEKTIRLGPGERRELVVR